MEPRSDYYLMPPYPWTSFKYCDVFKLVKKRISQQIIKRYTNLGTAGPLGKPAP